MSLLLIAALGAVALGVSRLARRWMPEIIVFLALGVLIGPQGPWPLITEANLPGLRLLTDVGLGVIIFLIGDRLRLDRLSGTRQALGVMNFTQLALTVVVVFFATRLAGADSRVALVLGLIAAETGVLTVAAIVAQERARGRLSGILLSSVAVTNVAVAFLFGVAYPFVLAATGATASTVETLLVFAQIVVASTAIGALGGYVLRVIGESLETSGELLLAVAVVITAMVGGAIAVDGSVVIATLVAGLLIANGSPLLADRMFATLRLLEAPVYLIFFVVAGATIHLDELGTAGLVGLAYFTARTVGKLAGTTLGSVFARLEGGPQTGLRLGVGLLPHAGMALALVAFVVESSPELGPPVSVVVLGSMVAFELISPLGARIALRRAGESRPDNGKGAADLTSIDYTLDRVLVPVAAQDSFSPRVSFLLDVVAAMKAEVIAVHVAPRPLRDGHSEALERVAEECQRRNMTCTTEVRVSERVASSIVAAAKEHDADVILMGAPAKASGLEPARWGSVSRRVLHDAPVPVLMFPFTGDDVRPPSR